MDVKRLYRLLLDKKTEAVEALMKEESEDQRQIFAVRLMRWNGQWRR